MTIKIPSFMPHRRNVEHWTEHDFEMERIGEDLRRAVYQKRLEQIETVGWVPFQAPFYYAGREFHGGHFAPGTKKRVPTTVAFAMFQEQNPDVALEPYPPHPHGWTPPTTTRGMFRNELVSVEPMKVPVFKLLEMDFLYGTEEERARDARMKEAFDSLPGVWRYGTAWVCDDTEAGKRRGILRLCVTVESEEHRSAIPTTWEGLEVDIKVKSQAEERAEKRAARDADTARDREEREWLRKAERLDG